MQAANQIDVGIRERCRRRESAIAPVRLDLPRVAGERQTKAAELAEHRGARRLRQWRARSRIAMDVVHVADLRVRPSTRVVHNPARIVLFDPLDDSRGVVLAPSFIEWHPHDDGRVVAVFIDQFLELHLELPRGLRRPRPADDRTRHVLPDEQTQAIGPHVPAIRFHFDVLARHVEAEPLRDVDVVSQRRIGRRGVQPVWPPALVERPNLKQRLVVQAQPRRAISAFAKRRLPHAEI
jgi:hypothetical protein